MMQSDSEVGLELAGPARSGCPINLATEVLGDRWSLLVMRDLAFGGPRHYRELLAGSLEGIASNILVGRLEKLTALGLLSRHAVPGHRQQVQYRLTEPGIQLLPIMVALASWAVRWLPADPELAQAAIELREPVAQQAFMDELRRVHLGAPRDGSQPRV